MGPYESLLHAFFHKILRFIDYNRLVPRFPSFGLKYFLFLSWKCLHYGLVPFIIDDRHKMFYYRGLKEWPKKPGYLRDTCLLMQDDFKSALDYFEISYDS